MGRIIAVYGVIGGIIVSIGMWFATIAVLDKGGSPGMVVGYLTMLAAMTMVFAGVKRYRDTVQGGVIRFLPAFGVGIAIALIAALFYVATWEVYLFQSGYRFMDDYVAGLIETMRAEGKPAAEIAKFSGEMDAFKAQYANPLLRALITLSEIAPVGLLVALISAAILRNPRAFPAKAATA